MHLGIKCMMQNCRYEFHCVVGGAVAVAIAFAVSDAVFLLVVLVLRLLLLSISISIGILTHELRFKVCG